MLLLSARFLCFLLYELGKFVCFTSGQVFSYENPIDVGRPAIHWEPNHFSSPAIIIALAFGKVKELPRQLQFKSLGSHSSTLCRGIEFPLLSKIVIASLFVG